VQTLLPLLLVVWLSPASFEAAQLRVESLRLGAPVGAFEAKYPGTLCDADPIDGKTRQIWFHAPAPCRKAEPLPGGTIVVLYTKDKSPESPIDAVAWFGNWPKSGGNFPLEVGIKVPAVDKALGPGKRLFDFTEIVRGGEAVVVRKHGSALYSITRDEIVIGYLAGRMGEDRTREEWRGLVKNVLRYLK
jgi:hypothetical protein